MTFTCASSEIDCFMGFYFKKFQHFQKILFFYFIINFFAMLFISQRLVYDRSGGDNIQGSS